LGAVPAHKGSFLGLLKRGLRMKAGVALIALAASMPMAGAQVEELVGEVPEGQQMLLVGDTLVYDFDQGTVSAVGGVQIEYGGINVVAQRVTYNQNTSRVIASGGVEIRDRDGNTYYAEEIDITDDFSDGFVRALRVETTERTYMAAESAERSGGNLTTFVRGVYTACEPCEENPDRPPLWQIKAQKVVWDGKAKTIRFERSRFEFLGVPLAFLPYFEVADPTVKRKSGILMPSIVGGSELGVGVRVPYYFALSPTYDLTVSATGYGRQGFMGEAEWRQQFNNGSYSLKIAGIHQNDPAAWRSNRIDSTVENRFMVGTQGQFQINPRWTTGWNILAQSDKNFSRTYRIEDFSSSVHRSTIYLTGLNDRNYFDLRGYHFQVQEDHLDSSPSARNDKQPLVAPLLDYSFTPDAPVFGGELNIDVNTQALYRDEGMYGTKLAGLESTSARFSAEAEWKRSFVTDAGFVLTPILHARGDAIYADLSQAAITEIQDFGAPEDIRSHYYRAMATAGLEARWPILFSSASSTHVLEPMGQIFVRPDEPNGGRLGIPNEDAQSLVFDASTLFERDKFSGYDRIEGGTRANLGIRYSGNFGGGWRMHGIAGQSFHLAGRNSFAEPDLVNVGAYSGLESARSDYVAMLGVATPFGISASASARFDEETFEMRRKELRVGANFTHVSANAQYAYIAAQPEYGFGTDRQEVSGSATLRFNENWRVFGSATYNVQESELVNNALGFGYSDECFIYTMSFSQARDNGNVESRIGFNISLRTLGEIGSNTFAQ
jgi:LPS-assembly protein